jgi:hypothetical protein
LQELPSSVAFPRYYVTIANPVSMRQILVSAKRWRYSSFGAILDDLERMAQNAEQFNGFNSHVSAQARFLQSEARKQFQELSCRGCGVEKRVVEKKKTVAVVVCKSCESWQCARCVKCSCLIARHTEIRMREFDLENSQLAREHELLEKIENLMAEECSLLVQMMAESRPELFDRLDMPTEVSIELTPKITERIASLFI